MVFDFHVHFFPDNVAEKALSSLSEIGGVKPYGSGTFDSLVSYMKEDHIDYVLNQPVATKPDQVISINRQMININKKSSGVLSFGSMHPDFGRISDPAEELSFISQNGLKGIKLHSEYQDFYPDDDKLTPIYEACAKYNIIVLFHSGRDLGFTSVHATPDRLRQVARVPGIKLVLAHMGAYQLWNDVEKYLVGINNIYFDTAFTVEMDNSRMKELIKGQGFDKVLYASDFPWERQSLVYDKIKSLNLPSEAEELIFYKNAFNLLNFEMSDFFIKANK